MIILVKFPIGETKRVVVAQEEEKIKIYFDDCGSLRISAAMTFYQFLEFLERKNAIAEEIQRIKEGQAPPPLGPVFSCKMYSRNKDEKHKENEMFTIHIFRSGVVFSDYSRYQFSYFNHSETLELIDEVEKRFSNLYENETRF